MKKFFFLRICFNKLLSKIKFAVKARKTFLLKGILSRKNNVFNFKINLAKKIGIVILIVLILYYFLILLINKKIGIFSTKLIVFGKLFFFKKILRQLSKSFAGI